MRPTYKEHMRAMRAAYLREVLAETGGNVTAAAKRAGLSRTYFYHLLGTAKITVEAPRRGNAAWQALGR